MTPAEKAKEFFGAGFYDILDDHLDHGYVYSGPDAFAFAMPHAVGLLRPDLNKGIDRCDCWFIQYVTGDLKRLLELLNDTPHDFEHIVFNRNDGDYRVYKMEKFHGKIKST